MRNFTQYIHESRKKLSSQVLSGQEVNDYIKVVAKTITKEMQNLLFLTQKYNLYSTDSLEEIRLLTKNELETASKTLSISLNDLTDMWEVLTKLKDNELKALPQYQDPLEREAVMQKKLRVSDITIDLKTDAGKRDVIKMYTPLIHKIVNQFIGKSKLNRAELISAAMVGFNDAINDWKPEGVNGKRVSFKTYSGYRVRQQILNDINEYGHSLSGTSWYSAQKAKDGLVHLDASSLDTYAGDDEWENDHLAELGVEDRNVDDTEHWKKLFKAIEDKFKTRDVDIFYRYFGLNGRKKEKSKDIAKSYGMSEGNIRNSVINKILAFLRSDKQLLDILIDLQDIYNEGLMIEMIHMDKQQIVECLLNDDTFILLEEINRWSRKDTLLNSVNNALVNFKDDDKDTILRLLAGGFDDIDDNYKKNKKLIIEFLTNIYPTESFVRKSDIDIIDRMVELQEAWRKFKK